MIAEHHSAYNKSSLASIGLWTKQKRLSILASRDLHFNSANGVFFLQLLQKTSYENNLVHYIPMLFGIATKI